MKKITNLVFIPLFAVLFFLLGCEQEPDFDRLHYEILDLHKATLRAHLDKDVEFFTRNISETYFSAGNGNIRHPAKQEIFNQFSRYLARTEFKKYQDVDPPTIGFSDDGSLAWCLVRVKVAGTQRVDVDSVDYFNTTWAWITLYQKNGDQWIRLGEVSSHD